MKKLPTRWVSRFLTKRNTSISLKAWGFIEKKERREVVKREERRKTEERREEKRGKRREKRSEERREEKREREREEREKREKERNDRRRFCITALLVLRPMDLIYRKAQNQDIPRRKTQI